MGNSYRVRIGLREIQAMEPNTILWDLEVKGFVARRQFSEVVTFSVPKRPITCGYFCVSVIALCWVCASVKESVSSVAPLVS